MIERRSEPAAGGDHTSLAARANRRIARIVVAPTRIELIGNEVAIRWADGAESFIAVPALRAASPSASARGEPDIFGRIHGGEAPRDFTGVTVTGWEIVGNYAVRFAFSDGHSTGLYTYELLRTLGGPPPAS